MKRGQTIFLSLVAACALGGLAMALTASSDAGLRGALSQGMLTAALIGFVGIAVWKPGGRHAAAMSGVGREVDGARRSQCGFRDVAANEVALRSLMELKDYLATPEKYARYGARMPRGVLLYGPPGTGKTLLARALAGEANVPFFALSGSDFVEKYVGVGASRVRELFQKARKAGRCVIFIDEIDAMGKRRDEGSSDERDQTLNALLSEMSGFHTGDGVVVIAATNRLEMLDPALLRPGRFDRQIEVGLPGREERLSILRLHSRNKPMGEDVDLERTASRTTGFSGASLENLLNEAAILAANRGGGCIDAGDLESAFVKVVAGEDRPSAATEREREIIAVHEAGHALLSHLLLPENELARVTILPSEHGAAGYSLSIPAERTMVRRQQLERQIQVLLGGRAAEAVCFGAEALSAGAASDIARATELAAAMVMELGMSGEPAVSWKVLSARCGGSGDGPERCRALLNALYDEACGSLRAHTGALQQLAGALLEREVLSGGEATQIMNRALSNERQESTEA